MGKADRDAGARVDIVGVALPLCDPVAMEIFGVGAL